MEVVTIEKRTFSYVCERFTEFAKRIESLCSTHTQKVENWLDSQELSDPNFIPDGSNSVYIIFMLIGIIGYFTIPTVSNWIIQAGGMGNMSRNINSAANKTGSGVGAVAGAATGNAGGRVGGKLIKGNQ